MAIRCKGAHFPPDSILMGVRWYVAYPLSYRPVEELLEERGVPIDHATIQRWVVNYSPLLAEAFHRRKHPVWVSWRMELLFKLWKSYGRVDESRSRKPWRILCEVYAKLLAMVVQHWLFLVSCWTSPHRSLTKAAQTVQQHALHMASTFGRLPALVMAITTVMRCLAAGCRMHRRKKHPNTYQLLLEATGL